MDKETFSKLDNLKQEFNEEIRKTFEQGKPKIKLENEIENIVNEYMSKVESYFNIIEQGFQVRTYFESEFAEFKRTLRNRTGEITTDVSTFLIGLNNSEFDKNIEILSQEKSSVDARKEELNRNSSQKLSRVQNEKDMINRDAFSRAEIIKEEVDHILERTCARAKTLVMTASVGRQLMLSLSKVEAMTNGIAVISNGINNQLGDKYMQAVVEYKETVYDAFVKANDRYENGIMQRAGIENDLSKPDNNNPFRLSDDIIKKVEMVGKVPVVQKHDNTQERTNETLSVDQII